MSRILTLAWWKAAGIRAFRTALVIAIPYVPTVVADGSYIIVGLAALFGALVSIAMNVISGIPEVADTTEPWYFSILSRVTKTSVQALLIGVGTATTFSEVNWGAVPALVATAALGSLLLGVMKQLPESDAPVATATTLVTNYNTVTGTESVQQVPVAPVTAPTFGDIIVTNPATPDTTE